MINLLYSSIINNKIVYKLIFIERYMQSGNYEDDDKMFFTNCQYRQDQPMCNQFRDMLLSSHPSYWPGKFKYTKKCFIYPKVSYWSSNHTQQEWDNSKKKFDDHFSKYKARPNYEQNF